MKTYFRGATLLVLLIAALLWYHMRKPDDTGTILLKDGQALRNISVRFPIPALRATMGPFIAAQANGFYAQEGLNVQFNYTSKAVNPGIAVASGQDQIGIFGGLDSVLTTRGSGAEVKAVALINQDSNFPCLITHADSGITKLKQLEGKRVGFFYGHISADVIRSLLRSQGVKVQEVDVGFDATQFVSRRVDANWAFTTAFAVELPEQGIPVNTISPADYGITTQGYTVFVKEDYLKKNREVVVRFLRATFRGVSYAKENEKEVVQMLVERDNMGNLTHEQVLSRLKQVNQVSGNFDPHPPGYFNEKMIRDTYQRLEAERVIDQPFKLESVYDRSLIEEIHGAKIDVRN